MTTSPRGLYLTLVITVLVTAALGALLLRPDSPLKPGLDTTFEPESPA